MVDTLLRIWRRQRALSIAFVLAVALTLVLGVRSMVFVPRFSEPPPEMVIEGWMTPRLVAHAHDLPPEVMMEALGLAPGEGRGKTLEDIAAAQHVPVAELIARIVAAEAAFRAGQTDTGAKDAQE